MNLPNSPLPLSPEQSPESSSNSEHDFRWDQILRYRLIEIIAYWEGRLTTKHLCNTFKIGRQQASKDINHYKNELAPNNLEYDNQLKGYRPSEGFNPLFTSGMPDEYLNLLYQNQMLKKSFPEFGMKPVSTLTVQPPTRSVKPETLRPIIEGIRKQKRLEVDYVSIASPNREGRIISPHTLVHNGVRWHVRAYCEKNGDYRDFVLSRFRSVPESIGDTSNKKEQDTLWNTSLTLKLSPDPRLSEDQQEVLIEEYNMQNGVLEIETNAALATYVLRELQVEHRFLEQEATAQQLILTNLPEVKPYLFDA
jgi:predicted DNA-binding transcriptional regulator YafY